MNHICELLHMELAVWLAIPDKFITARNGWLAADQSIHCYEISLDLHSEPKSPDGMVKGWEMVWSSARSWCGKVLGAGVITGQGLGDGVVKGWEMVWSSARSWCGQELGAGVVTGQGLGDGVAKF